MHSDHGTNDGHTGRQGIVRDLRDGRALIAIDCGGCSGCGKQNACGIGRLAGSRGETRIEMKVPAEFCVGDKVTLQISEDRLLGAALIGYLLPALTLLAGAGVGQAVRGDGTAVVGAVLGFAVGIAAARALHSLRRADTDLVVRAR